MVHASQALRGCSLVGYTSAAFRGTSEAFRPVREIQIPETRSQALRDTFLGCGQLALSWPPPLLLLHLATVSPETRCGGSGGSRWFRMARNHFRNHIAYPLTWGGSILDIFFRYGSGTIKGLRECEIPYYPNNKGESLRGTETWPGSGTIFPRRPSYALTWGSVPSEWFRKYPEPVPEPVPEPPTGSPPGVPRGGFVWFLSPVRGSGY